MFFLLQQNLLILFETFFPEWMRKERERLPVALLSSEEDPLNQLIPSVCLILDES